jgi:hypothetical protein
LDGHFDELHSPVTSGNQLALDERLINYERFSYSHSPVRRVPIMFKLNDKKHRKRALLKLQNCKPNCGANGENDEVYEVSNGHQKVTNKTLEYEVKYNLDEAPSHLVRKTMKFEEIKSGSGFDEVDRVGSSQRMRQVELEFPSIERNVQSKVVT